MGTQRTPSKFSDLWRVLGLALPYRKLLLVGFLALIGGTTVNLFLPELIRNIVNQGSSSIVLENPILSAGLLVLLFGFQGLCFYFRHYLFGIVGQNVVADIRKKLYSAVMKQEIGFFDTSRVGDLVSRVSSDTVLLQDAVSTKLSVIVRYSLQVIVGIVLMALISIKLTLALLFILPILIGLSIVLGKRLKYYSRLQQEELGKATIITEETFSGVRVVRAFNRSQFELTRFAEAADKVLSAGVKRTGIAAFFASFVSFLMNAGIVVVLIYGLQLVVWGDLSAGDLTAFLLYGVIVAVSFSFLSNGFAEILQATGAAERIFSLLDRETPPSTRGEIGVSFPSPEKIQGEIKFSSVSFAYPARPETNVLDDLSFQIPHGKATALVGPSGAGKSTILSLLLRFYDPTDGAITFDGLNLLDLSPEELRNHIAIVPQDPEFFATSIAQNLRYGKETATLDELRNAAERARLLEFIESLPEGFETNVGHRGIQLSGGQKQRLGIARAMLRDPALLILDEATSSLDSENEHLVQLALNELMAGRSSLVVAHRLSTIKNASQVLVLENGKLVQSGTHESLSSSPGLYQRLVRRQELQAEREDSLQEPRHARQNIA